MALKPNVLKTVRKPAPKGKQALGKKKKTKKGLVRHGLFLFKSDCNLQESIESNMVDGLEHEKQMLQLMYMYQTYHNIAQMRQYASRGSKLVCQYGTKPALLDTLVDHGVYAGTRPVMTCADCREENLHDFGSCMCPERFYEDRLPMTVAVHQNGTLADRAPYNKYPHICVPLVNTQDGWYQVETGVVVEESNGGAFQALLEGALLVCQFGGVITIPEVLDGEQDTFLKDENDTEERICETTKYVVLPKKMYVRKTPSDADESNRCTFYFVAGKRIDAFENEIREDQNGNKWRLIDISDMNMEEKVAWVADRYILPDKPVVTEAKDFPAEVTMVIDDKEETLTPLQKWGIAGGFGEDVPEKNGDRYNIAIGPKIMNPNYEDSGEIKGEEFLAFNRNVDVVVRHKQTGEEKTIPCYEYTLKAHSYNKYPDGHIQSNKPNAVVTADVKNGILQTGICYPNATNPAAWAPGHNDGSIIEFCNDSTGGISCIEYELVKVIAYLKEESEFEN